MELKGIYAPIPTPFTSDGSLDLPSLRTNLDAWTRSPLDGLVVCGSNGEQPFLEPEERALLVRTVRDRSGSRSAPGCLEAPCGQRHCGQKCRRYQPGGGGIPGRPGA